MGLLRGVVHAGKTHGASDLHCQYEDRVTSAMAALMAEQLRSGSATELTSCNVLTRCAYQPAIGSGACLISKHIKAGQLG